MSRTGYCGLCHHPSCVCTGRTAACPTCGDAVTTVQLHNGEFTRLHNNPAGKPCPGNLVKIDAASDDSCTQCQYQPCICCRECHAHPCRCAPVAPGTTLTAEDVRALLAEGRALRESLDIERHLAKNGYDDTLRRLHSLEHRVGKLEPSDGAPDTTVSLLRQILELLREWRGP